MSKDEKSSKNLKQDNSDYKKAHDKWVKEVLEPALAKHPERNKKFMTTSSQEVDRLYTPLDNLKIRIQGEFTRQCIAVVCGQCECLQVLVQLRKQMKDSSIC